MISIGNVLRRYPNPRVQIGSTIECLIGKSRLSPEEASDIASDMIRDSYRREFDLDFEEVHGEGTAPIHIVK